MLGLCEHGNEISAENFSRIWQLSASRESIKERRSGSGIHLERLTKGTKTSAEFRTEHPPPPEYRYRHANLPTNVRYDKGRL
jgi:hypothetical protein